MSRFWTDLVARAQRRRVQSRQGAGRGRAGLALLGVAGFALTACSSGQGAHTADQVAAINGAVGNAGKVALRDVSFAKPDGQRTIRAGQPAKLEYYLVNQAASSDTLVSVTSAVGDARLSGKTTVPTDTTVSDTVTADELDLPRVAAQRLDITVPSVSEPIVPGKAVSVTFLFRDAGEATLDVPLELPGQPRSNAPGEEEAAAAPSLG